jgi:hypothetical protein
MHIADTKGTKKHPIVFNFGNFGRRMRWKPKQPLTVVELKCQQLKAPILLPQSDKYYGCFSWLELEGVELAVPVGNALPHATFLERQASLRQALSKLDAQEINLSSH